MNNIVSEMDALAHALESEKALRQATLDERAQGQDDGPMRAAHDQAIATVLVRARALVEKAQS